MSANSLLFPMLALVLLTFGVATLLFRARVRSVREGHVAVSYFRVFQGSPEPEFLAGRLVPLLLAWGYVAARCAHTYVHLGSKHVRYRLRTCFIGWLLLLGLWIAFAVHVVMRG